VLLGVGPLHAQSASTASIGGTIRDASGGVLPGVTVTSTQTETRQARTAVSDGDGAYLIPGLPVGPYRLEFVLSGFRTYAQTGIVLQVITRGWQLSGILSARSGGSTL
jgi:Carboxypeptidase regulatory-like domain